MDITPHIAAEPMPGRFYTIRYGDTLFEVTSRAFGVPAGAHRLEFARMINASRYNDRFRGAPTDLFPDGLVSFLPRFVSDPNAQAAAQGSSPRGHGFATLWIPRAPGDEPAFDDPEPELRIVEIGVAEAVEDDELQQPGPPIETKYAFLYKVQTGDSLEIIADALGVRWEYLAQLNWGTDVPEEINYHLEHHFVCRRREGSNFAFSSEDEPGLLLLPRQLTPARRRRIRALRASRFAVGS
jgi:hypothetical protein